VAKTKVLVGGGHPVGELVAEYLNSRRPTLRPSSIKTLEFRLRTITKGRATVPVEAFPWRSAWSDLVDFGCCRRVRELLHEGRACSAQPAGGR
jgi:hypothetical protein